MAENERIRSQIKDQISALDLKIYADLRDIQGEFTDEVSLVN